MDLFKIITSSALICLVITFAIYVFAEEKNTRMLLRYVAVLFLLIFLAAGGVMAWI